VKNNSDVIEIATELSKATDQMAKWVLCVPEASPIKSVRT